MSSENQRKIKNMYFIDSRAMEQKPFIEAGSVYDVDAKSGSFTVEVSDDDHRQFKISNLGEIVFQTFDEAQELLSKLPKVGQTIYCIETGKRKIMEQIVKCYSALYIMFESGKSVHVTDASKTFFLNKDEARAALKR